MPIFGTVNATNDLSFRNKIINGNFSVWQRATSGTTTDGYASADRWKMARVTLARQSHTPGTTWSQSQYFANFSWTSQQNAYISQAIEDVTMLAGKTITLSYWAKSSTSTTLTHFISQRFGTNGSEEVVALNFGQNKSLTTSWARYSVTVSLPSITGKTLGPLETTLTNFAIYGSPKDSNTTGSVDISDVQVEIGSEPTSFEVRPLGIETNLCYRYFYSSIANDMHSVGWHGLGTGNYVIFTMSNRFPVSMRVSPTVTLLAYGYDASRDARGDGRTASGSTAGFMLYTVVSEGGNGQPSYPTATFGSGVASNRQSFVVSLGENTVNRGLYFGGYTASAEL